MQWWHRLTEPFLDALHERFRFTAEPRVRIIPLVRIPRMKPVKINMSRGPVPVPCFEEPKWKQVGPDLGSGRLHHLTSEQPRDRRLPVSIRARSTGVPDIQLISRPAGEVNCSLGEIEGRQVPCLQPEVSGGTEVLHTRPPEVCYGLPQPPGAGMAISMEPVRGSQPRINLKAIAAQPLVLRPQDWSRLDKELIIACWELIKGQAIEEMGHDPGKSLEMVAIFDDIDMDNIDRVSFDLEKRELHLFPRTDDLPGPHTGRCAIIIGAVRRTGKLLMATLPIDSGSD